MLELAIIRRKKRAFSTINESVDLIAFLFNIEANKKFYHRHIVDISESRASLTGG